MCTLIPAKGHVWVPNALAFWVFDPLEGDSTRGLAGEMQGYFRPRLDWQTEKMGG
jgi:hypothetical protein